MGEVNCAFVKEHNIIVALGGKGPKVLVKLNALQAITVKIKTLLSRRFVNSKSLFGELEQNPLYRVRVSHGPKRF